MNNIFYQELRNANTAIKNATYTSTENDIFSKEVMEAGLAILQFSNIARKEGLLALEEAFQSFKMDKKFHMPIKLLGELIVDGTDPQLVEDIGYNTYFGEVFEGYDALIFLICLRGMLSIQAGENPRVIEFNITSMMPAGTKEKFHNYVEDYNNGKIKKKNQPVKNAPADPRTEADIILGKLKEQSFKMFPEENGYYLVKLVDMAFTKMEDKNVQRVLREMENSDVAVLLSVMSGKANSSILGNLSNRLADMIAIDASFVYNGKSKAPDIAKKTLAQMVKLHHYAEICFKEGDLVAALLKMFTEDYEAKQERDRQKREETKEIEDMLSQFRDMM